MDSIDYKILTTIGDGKYHSGQTLAKQFNTSRAAICKRISKLKLFLEEQTLNSFRINTVVGRGYCLSTNFDYLSLEEIYNHLPDQDIKLEFCPIIDSTNNYLLNKELQFDQYTVCLAEQQTNGRGRRSVTRDHNSTWFSPFGNNIYFSIGWNYTGNQNALLGISLVAGISIAETLATLGCSKIGLKWPNDVWLGKKKIAGVLTEIQGEPNGGCKLVIGIGMNVFSNYSAEHLKQLNNNISQPWTSILTELSNNKEGIKYLANISRNCIIAELLTRLVTYYKQFINHGLSGFLLKWQQYDTLLQKLVDIDISGKKKHGKVLGIDKQGALLVDIAGQIQAFYSGEVKVRAVQ